MADTDVGQRRAQQAEDRKALLLWAAGVSGLPLQHISEVPPPLPELSTQRPQICDPGRSGCRTGMWESICICFHLSRGRSSRLLVFWLMPRSKWNVLPSFPKLSASPATCNLVHTLAIDSLGQSFSLGGFCARLPCTSRPLCLVSIARKCTSPRCGRSRIGC